MFGQTRVRGRGKQELVTTTRALLAHARLTDRAIFMDHGYIVEIAKKHAFVGSSRNPRAQDFRLTYLHR